MANFTQTLTTSINFMGPQATTKWNTPMKFGSDSWGYTTHTTGNFFMPVAALSFHNDTGPSFVDGFANNFGTVGSSINTFIITQGTSQVESLYERSLGWKYVLAGGVTNDEQAYIPTYTTVANPSSSWSLASSAPASWVSS